MKSSIHSVSQDNIWDAFWTAAGESLLLLLAAGQMVTEV